jgi:sulfofructose kinase
MKSPDIIGVGRCTLDLIFRIPRFPTWEKGVVYDDYSIDGGGQASTGLVAASKLGASTGYIGTAGTDVAGDLKIGSLNDWGVDTSRVIRRPGPDGQVILVTVNSATGERSFTYSNALDTRQTKPEELDKPYITAAKYLLIDGSHPEAALQAAKWMHEAGKPVMLDGSKTRRRIPEDIRVLIPYVDLLVCGAGFGEALSGEDDIRKAGEKILDMGPSVFVETLGERGSVTVTGDDHFETPAFKVDVKDTTGAGDVFHGAYLYSLLRGWDTRYAATFSTAVSALKCTRMGGRKGAPNLNEVEAFLTTHDAAPPTLK